MGQIPAKKQTDYLTQAAAKYAWSELVGARRAGLRTKWKSSAFGRPATLVQI